jgi:SAM-dependent methyltransferase
MVAARLFRTFLRWYAAREATAVAPFVLGRRVLDLGAGEGYVAAWLRERSGVWTAGVDVARFRRTRVPYVAYDGARLPFPDAAFDTTLILLTLHHCAKPEGVLDEALRVTRRRVIVTESVYRNARERCWLDLWDGRLNALRHDGRMPVPFAFRRPEEWQVLFASRGLQTVERRWIGPWWERLVHHPLMFVLDTPGLRTED